MVVDYKKKNRNQNIILSIIFVLFIICYIVAKIILNSDFYSTVLILIIISGGIGTLVWYYTTDYLQPRATISNNSISFYEKRFMAIFHRMPKMYKIYYSNFLYVFTIGKTIMINTKDGEIYMIKEKQVDNMIKFHEALLKNLKPLNIKVHHMEDPLLQVSK